MTQPERSSELDDTLLDEGRSRLFGPRRGANLEPTILDEGRQRPAGQPLDWPDDGSLPEPLAELYEVTGRWPEPGRRVDLYPLRRRSDGTEAVLKRYRTARAPHADVVAYLLSRPNCTVRFLEFGPGYEVMEYARAGDLLRGRDTTPAGFSRNQLQEIVQQVASALIALHRLDLVHRDVKPSNVLLRSTDPLDAVLADFGLAGRVGEAVPEGLNPAYQPPEAVLRGRRRAAADWWGLGMTILELASGEHAFDGLDPDDIKDHFAASRGIDVSAVPDDRLRSLCQGLLALDEQDRWGAEKVGLWLVGRGPDPPAATARRRPSVPEPASAKGGFRFHGTAYFYRDEMAAAMATEWNYAVDFLVRRGGLDKVYSWMDQFSDDEAAEVRLRIDAVRQNGEGSEHVRLVDVVRALDPGAPPVYRNHRIARAHLSVMAHQALAGEGDSAPVLQDLWRERLLPRFDAATTGGAGAEAGGAATGQETATGSGQALTDLDRSWQAELERWRTLVATVNDREARELLEQAADDSIPLAYSLRAALNQPGDVDAAREAVRATAAGLAAPLPWFHDLAARPAMVWVALALCGHALSRAQTLADRQRLICENAERERAAVRFREWSRRQNRPVALGWAVAGVCLMAVVWVLLIVASDRADWVSDRTVDLAWVAAAACFGVSLLAECLLAAQVGGRFHVRYSIPGAAGIALRPIGRWMQRAPLLALVVILGGITGLVLVALQYPETIPAGATVLHLVWVVYRGRTWLTRRDAEETVIAEARNG
jgi:hypothetical protein